jgi:LruC domain-containing protein
MLNLKNNFQKLSNMKNTINSLCAISFSFLFFCSCDIIPDVEQIDSLEIEETVKSLLIPEGFDFSTSHPVTVNITDNSNYAKYDVFAYTGELYDAGTETFENESGEIVTEVVYKSDVMEKLLFSGVPKNGQLHQIINVPKFYTKVYIRRNEHLNFSSSIENIVSQEVSYTFGSSAKSTVKSKSYGTVTDYLFCVNGPGELFQINPLSGELTDLSSMPTGSVNCAIDQDNKVLYSIGNTKPYELMKYSIENDTWEIIAEITKTGPRLDFNKADGLLYFSSKDRLITYDTSTGEEVERWTIIGLHDTRGGDLAFAEDGTLYLCTFSGLYKLELDGNNDYQSTRISAENLPFQPTSMTFDSNQDLWLANSSGTSDLIVMDTKTGGWRYKYGVSANNNTNFRRAINDLTTFRVFSDEEDEDSDGDGILDQDDAFPDDPEEAFEHFTPSKYGKGTIAFEDLWPSSGDYDFNDAALSYQVIAVLNADNLAVRIDFICNIKSNGAGNTNGIGIQIDGLVPSQIESVSGPVLNQGFINLNGNGTEANQDKAVIIFADDVDNILEETTISVNFVTPISTADLGVAPFNPFLIVNKEREKEIHLPYMNVTSLGSTNIEFNGVNKDADGDFISDNGYPWAISIVHDFKVPKEKEDIKNAYNFFGTWAESGGIDYDDWYTDKSGHRNIDKIKN